MRKFLVFVSILFPLICAYFIVPKVQGIYIRSFSPPANIEDIRRSVGPRLITSLAKANLQLGAPSFNLGFPNAYDHAHSRTGSYLMVHGDCDSIGCYAMTSQSIEEIYLIVEAALLAGQSSVPVYAFPFKMTAERLRSERDNQWYPYWNDLKAGYDLFVKNAVPPAGTVRNGHYVFPQG